MTLTDCVTRATGCKNADYVSFSPTFKTCSWYKACDFTAQGLRQFAGNGTDYQSQRVKPATSAGTNATGCCGDRYECTRPLPDGGNCDTAAKGAWHTIPPPAPPQGNSGFGCDALVVGSIDVALRTAQLLNKHGKVPMYSNPASFARPLKTPIWMNESRLVDALAGTAWMVNYEFMRAESIMNGCPGANITTGECILDNMLAESKLGVAAGVHTYLKRVNASDPNSPIENQLPHMAAFMLAQQEHWYYFGSTGWWDDDYVWDELFDKVSTCGKPTELAPAVGSGPVYTRAFEHCKVSLDCTDSASCKGDIQFGTGG